MSEINIINANMQRLASDEPAYEIQAVLWEFFHGVLLKFTVEEISQVSSSELKEECMAVVLLAVFLLYCMSVCIHPSF